MTPTRIALLAAQVILMSTTLMALTGIENWIARLGTTTAAQLMLGQIGLGRPYGIAATLGVILLFAAKGAAAIRYAGCAVLMGAAVFVAIAIVRENVRLAGFASNLPEGSGIAAYTDPATASGGLLSLIAGAFALRVALRGNAALAVAVTRRMSGRRAIMAKPNGWRSTRPGAISRSLAVPLSERPVVLTRTVSRIADSAPTTARHGAQAAKPDCCVSTPRSARRTGWSLPDQAGSRRHP